tara:strand:- start:2661 stop:3260 length:600 start_codon:yes stop_codon:yes gene_type:complete
MKLINTKKAAMFGLDARIALAIFGALSVISGAALYSAIQDAKVTAIITELNEVGKAYDQYYLDVGEELTLSGENFYLLNAELFASSKAGWKGPYLSGAPRSTVWTDKEYGFQELRDGTWNGITPTDRTEARCTKTDISGSCAVWATVLLGANKGDLARAIDLKVDGVVDGTTGNVRLMANSGETGSWYVLLKQRISFRY